ncbi:MAG: hypothetical protein R3A52_16050 [Polyangiales bacterium]
MFAGCGWQKSASLSTRSCTGSPSTVTFMRATRSFGTSPFTTASRCARTPPIAAPHRNPTESCGAEFTPRSGTRAPMKWLTQRRVPSPPTLTTRSKPSVSPTRSRARTLTFAPTASSAACVSSRVRRWCSSARRSRATVMSLRASSALTLGSPCSRTYRS